MHAKNIFSVFEKKFITVAGIIQLFEVCHSWPSEVNKQSQIYLDVEKRFCCFSFLNTVVYIHSFYLVLICQSGSDIVSCRLQH